MARSAKSEIKKIVKDYLEDVYPTSMGSLRSKGFTIEEKDFDIFGEVKKEGAGLFAIALSIIGKKGEDYDDLFERYDVKGIKNQVDLVDFMDRCYKEFLEEFAPKFYEITKSVIKESVITEAELTELKDAILNREEFIDENVVGTSIGEDYVISVFDKAVFIFTADNNPFIIGREDLTEEEAEIIDTLYSTLDIEVEDEIDDLDPEDDDEKSLKESKNNFYSLEEVNFVPKGFYFEDRFNVSTILKDFKKLFKKVNGDVFFKNKEVKVVFSPVGKKNRAEEDFVYEYKMGVEADSYKESKKGFVKNTDTIDYKSEPVLLTIDTDKSEIIGMEII